MPGETEMRAPPVVLSLETATRGGSIFLSQGETQLAARVGDPAISQSASLLSDINDCLAEAGLTLGDVKLFACAAGPGSFTGLRIGIATVKALAASLKQPCVGVPTLRAVAHAAGPSMRTVALLPAGRGEVFAQMFSVSDARVLTDIDTAAHLSPERLIERYAAFAELMWAGSGAEQHRDVLESYAQRNDRANSPHRWRFAEPEPNLAKHICILALQSFQNGTLQSPDALSAIYVRPSDAELNQQCR